MDKVFSTGVNPLLNQEKIIRLVCGWPLAKPTSIFLLIWIHQRLVL